MRNVLSSSVKVHRKFDLKGSTVDRAASHKEKVRCGFVACSNDVAVEASYGYMVYLVKATRLYYAS